MGAHPRSGVIFVSSVLLVAAFSPGARGQAEGPSRAHSGYVITSDVNGNSVTTRDAPNRNIGTVRGFVLAEPDGQALYMIVDVGGFLGIGAAEIVIPFSLVTFTGQGGRPLVAVPSDMIAAAPRVTDSDIEQLLADSNWRRSVADFYGVQPDPPPLPSRAAAPSGSTAATAAPPTTAQSWYTAEQAAAGATDFAQVLRLLPRRRSTGRGWTGACGSGVPGKLEQPHDRRPRQFRTRADATDGAWLVDQRAIHPDHRLHPSEERLSRRRPVARSRRASAAAPDGGKPRSAAARDGERAAGGWSRSRSASTIARRYPRQAAFNWWADGCGDTRCRHRDDLLAILQQGPDGIPLFDTRSHQYPQCRKSPCRLRISAGGGRLVSDRPDHVRRPSLRDDDAWDVCPRRHDLPRGLEPSICSEGP